MKKEVIRESSKYITINIVIFGLFLISIILGISDLSDNVYLKLLCRVISRGILGLLIIYNSLYIIFTRKWTFLCLNATPKKRLTCGVILGLVGLMALITAILGYGINGNPRLIWWR